MTDYMFLLYEEGTAYTELSPEEMQQVIAKYNAWSAELAQKGHLQGGEKLKDGEGRVLQRGTGRVINGPYSETKEVIGGYFTIQAKSYEEAVELAKTCPHHEFGTIEVREIDHMDGT